MKVLIITPCPTHPAVEGNCRRILNLGEAIRALGHELHVAYLPVPVFPVADQQAMTSWLDGHFHAAESIAPGSLRRWRNKASRLVDEARWKLIGRGSTSTYAPETAYDANYNPSWDQFIRRLHQKHAFDAVICEYVFVSRALRMFGPAVRKIVDTHDIFANRNQRLREMGLGNVEWLEASEEDEALGLRRADVVLAIQDDERVYFAQCSGRPVLTVGHVLDARSEPLPAPGGSPRVLMIGSPNPLNLQGLMWFLLDVWPRVRVAVPEAEFLVGGKLGDMLPPNGSGVRKLGVVERVEEAYEAAHVVVNPVQGGTGLAIKSVEAIGFGKPLVTGPGGARGLMSGRDIAFRLAESAEDFASHVAALLRSASDRQILSEGALTFVAKWNRQQRDNLALAVSGAAAAATGPGL